MATPPFSMSRTIVKQQLKRLLESSNKNAGVDTAANNNVDVKKKAGVGKKGNGYKTRLYSNFIG